MRSLPSLRMVCRWSCLAVAVLASPGPTSAQAILKLPLAVGWQDRLPAAAPNVAADRHGDPLPSGALLRLGTLRLRNAIYLLDVAFSADGKALVTVGHPPDSTVHLWDAATGKELHRFVSRWGYLCARCSPDGKLLALGCGDGRIHLIDCATRKPVRQIRVSSTRLAFSPD